MTLSDWDVKVRPHLHFIEAGAEMAARHAKSLSCRADFRTRAEDELTECRATLERALANVIAAQSIYANKESERAA
jgi:hypothetical protein